MDDKELKPNSHIYRNQAKKEEEKKPEIRRVNTEGAKPRKKSAFKKAAELFIEEDIGDLKYHIIHHILLPTIKDALYDVGNGALEMILFGSTKGRRTKSSSIDKPSYTTYYKSDKSSSSSSSSTVIQGPYEYEEQIFETRSGAEDLLLSLREYLNEWKSVSVNKYYDAINKPSGNFIDEEWGWTNLDRAKVRHVRNGWVVDLPRVEYLK